MSRFQDELIAELGGLRSNTSLPPPTTKKPKTAPPSQLSSVRPKAARKAVEKTALAVAVHNQQIGVKKDSGKLEYHLIPVECWREVVKVLTYSKRDKYAEDNWKKVPNARTRYLDAATRHIEARREGQVLDSEWSLHHTAHAICCLLFVMWFDFRSIRRKEARLDR